MQSQRPCRGRAPRRAAATGRNMLCAGAGRRLRRALLPLALTAATVIPGAAGAQEPAPRPPLLRVAPSLAWALGGDLEGSAVTSAGIRAEIPVGAHLAPWLSWSAFQLGIDCIPEAEFCPSDGTAWLAGVMLSAGGPARAALRPYIGVGAGQWHNDQEDRLTYGAVLGFALELVPVLAPAAEVRWERYPEFDEQVLLSLGVQLSLPRPGRGQ